jgi:hypothetical protein
MAIDLRSTFLINHKEVTSISFDRLYYLLIDYFALNSLYHLSDELYLSDFFVNVSNFS